MRHDLVADALSIIKNASKLGKKKCVVPASRLIKDMLGVMEENGFIGNFEFVNDGRSGYFDITLIGRINDCNVIKPRFSVKKDGFEKWERRFLPAREFGILILTTPHGVMTQRDAQKKKHRREINRICLLGVWTCLKEILTYRMM